MYVWSNCMPEVITIFHVLFTQSSCNLYALWIFIVCRATGASKTGSVIKSEHQKKGSKIYDCIYIVYESFWETFEISCSPQRLRIRVYRYYCFVYKYQTINIRFRVDFIPAISHMALRLVGRRSAKFEVFSCASEDSHPPVSVCRHTWVGTCDWATGRPGGRVALFPIESSPAHAPHFTLSNTANLDQLLHQLAPQGCTISLVLRSVGPWFDICVRWFTLSTSSRSDVSNLTV